MNGRRHLATAVAAAAALVAMAAFAAACGKDGAGSPSPASLKPAERFAEILGHEPQGLAKTIAERGAIVVANDLRYPPQSSVDKETQENVGFDVDVAKKVGELLDLEVRFAHPTWEKIPAGLQAGEFDVAINSLPITGGPGAKVGFTEPYYYMPAQVYVKEGGAQITGREDLAGMRVGVAAQTTSYDYLRERTEAVVETYESESDALDALADGDLDFALVTSLAGERAAGDGKPVEPSGEPLRFDKLAFATTKGEGDLVELLDHAIEVMRGDGSLAEASKQWFDGLDLTAAK